MVLNSDLMRGVAEPVILRLLAERMMYEPISKVLALSC